MVYLMQSAHQMLVCLVTFPQTISTPYIQPKEKNKRRNFSLELTGKTFCVTGTTPCLPTDFWVKLLWQGKALPRSSWWTTLFTDPLSYLQPEDLAAHLFTVLAAKAPEAVKFPHASENRTINLIYMIRGITFLSKWVAPKLVTFGK